MINEIFIVYLTERAHGAVQTTSAEVSELEVSKNHQLPFQ